MTIPSARGSYPLRPGNRLVPLVGPAEIFGRLGEAIDAARHSIWATVAFYRDDFHFPDGRTLFEALDAAVARGLDVRLLCWRPGGTAGRFTSVFPGTATDRAGLAARGSRVRIRWDRADADYCQHQKSWLFDAGHPAGTSFVGGANLTGRSLGFHDVYLELTGPAAVDVHHNFVQRWNEASERHLDDGNWAVGASDEMTFPEHAPRAEGASTVQVQRMLPAAHYGDSRAAPAAQPFAVAEGERSILEQYSLAIDAARHTIHIENQAVPIPPIAARLEDALKRGVEVLLLVPRVPEEYVFAARRDPARRPLFEGLEALGRYPKFRLVGLPAYVHAKLMIVDGEWATVGSCNLHAYSLGGHSELNVSIWDSTIAGALGERLRRRHEGEMVTLSPQLYGIERRS